jgi:hypothetical protein
MILRTPPRRLQIEPHVVGTDRSTVPTIRSRCSQPCDVYRAARVVRAHCCQPPDPINYPYPYQHRTVVVVVVVVVLVVVAVDINFG